MSQIENNNIVVIPMISEEDQNLKNILDFFEEQKDQGRWSDHHITSNLIKSDKSQDDEETAFNISNYKVYNNDDGEGTL